MLPISSEDVFVEEREDLLQSVLVVKNGSVGEVEDLDLTFQNIVHTDIKRDFKRDLHVDAFQSTDLNQISYFCLRL